MTAEQKAEEPQPIAVALRYDPEATIVPSVVGKGVGDVAERILALAKENGIPVRNDPDLLELLSGVQIGESIPPELYEVVAEVLTYLYQLNDSLDE